ncbi:hypothetical protein JCM11251_000196 [Rhodosporidiobolus azoricus]
MLRSSLRRALSAPPPRPLPRHLLRSLSSTASSSPLPRHRINLSLPRAAHPSFTRSYATYTSRTVYDKDIMTITDPAYQPHAPYPYITQPGSAFEHLPEGFEVVESKEGGKGRYAIFKGDIERSPNDDNVYRSIILENGMEAVLVSDPNTDKAAAAMAVKVGHLSDPEDIPGLAHFCEHLMFMGTEKYPAENDYTEFLTQHSGSSNAYTDMDQTMYHFDVAPEYLSPALDRFAQFFISPLFDPSCTEREANAVHSENSKNLQSDMWRLFQLDKSTSSRDHAFWRFGTGNRVTLWDRPRERGEDVRARLIEWCEKHYSANVCKLTVVGKDSLDDLTKLVVEHFSSVPNRHHTPTEFTGSPLTEKELGRTVFVKSVRDQRVLELTFPFPDESAYYASKSASFLSHLIGHEGKGSVLAFLKEKGWANGISAGSGNGATGFEFFKIVVDLTKEGLDAYEDVTSAVFAYISLLRSNPPPEWAYLEVSALSKLGFQFKEKVPPITATLRMCQLMHKPYPRELLLSAPWICTEWYPKKVEELLGLMTPAKCRIFLSAQEEVGGRTYGEREEWYGTEYTIEKMSEKILSSDSPSAPSSYPSLHLPARNALVPTDLEIRPPGKLSPEQVGEPAKRPEPVRNTQISRVWYKKDDRWWIPRAGAFFLLRNPAIDSTPSNSILSRLFTELVRDSLQEYAYDAELAGLSYNFDQAGDGILLTVDGYNDKLPVLVEMVTKRMREYKVDEARFEIIRDQLRRVYTNFRLEQPYQHAGYDGGHLLQALAWSIPEKLAALDAVTPADVNAHADALLKRGHLESLVHGNVTQEEALKLAEKVETTLGLEEGLTTEELKSHVALVVPEGKTLSRRPLENPDETNSSVEQFTYIGNLYDDLLRVKTSLFGTMISEPLFDDLRAKQQLGYIVSSGPRKSISFLGLRVIVQSEHDANFVESRIDQFWIDFRKRMDEMSEEEFDKYRQTVASRKLEDHKNMWQESSHMWTQIHAWWYDFEQRFRDAELVKTVSKADLIQYVDDHFFDSRDKRIRRLSIHVTSQRLGPAQLATLGPVLADMQVQVDPKQLEDFAATRPSIEGAKAFAEQFLLGQGRSEEEVKKVQEVIEGLRVLEVPEGLYDEVIEDREKWRSEREKAPPAHPVKEYEHLYPPELRASPSSSSDPQITL